MPASARAFVSRAGNHPSAQGESIVAAGPLVGLDGAKGILVESDATDLGRDVVQAEQAMVRALLVDLRVLAVTLQGTINDRDELLTLLAREEVGDHGGTIGADLLDAVREATFESNAGLNAAQHGAQPFVRQ